MTSIDCWIEHWARRRPSHTAIALPEGDLSWFDLSHRVHLTARAIAHAGVGRGDRVALLAGDGSLILEALFAAARLGASIVPLNTRLTAHELGVVLGDAEPRLLIADDPHGDAARDALDRSAVDVELLVVDPVRGITAADGPAPPRVGRPDDVVVIAYTSGTTGTPKGAMLDQRAITANASNVTAMMDLTSRDRVLNVMPQFHVGGLNVHSTPTLRAGGTLVQPRRFDPVAAFDELTERATLGTLVPAMLVAVQSLPQWRSARFTKLRALNTGSSSVPTGLIDEVHATGTPVTQIYGLTETSPLALALPAEHARDKVGSCGLAGLAVEVRLVAPDGHDVEPGEAGEIVVRGANVTTGYWNQPDATRAAFLDGGWFRTGDIVCTDVDGFAYIEDRRTDLIISGGENISPAELEAVLAEVDGIAEAVVVSSPDDRWGHVPVVVAVRADPTISDEAVLAAFDDRVARFKRPRQIRWVDRLPRTPMGKVKKHELRRHLSP
ncbi:MAG: AMP-binding protein [Actinomycetota bacterium]